MPISCLADRDTLPYTAATIRLSVQNCSFHLVNIAHTEIGEKLHWADKNKGRDVRNHSRP